MVEEEAGVGGLLGVDKFEAGETGLTGPGGGGVDVDAVVLAEPGKTAGWESEMLLLVLTSAFLASAKCLCRVDQYSYCKDTARSYTCERAPSH